MKPGLLASYCNFLTVVSVAAYKRDMNRERSIFTRILRLSFLTAAAALTVLISTRSTSAATYSVNRSWSDSMGTASLVGTVDLPFGNYTIMNGAPNPYFQKPSR